MKVYLGADHAGWQLKEIIKKYLDQKKVSYQDLGNKVLDKNDDYPDYSLKVANAVIKDKKSLGILFCGSSAGACITANKVKGIRAASVRSLGEAKLARSDDDANIICLAGGQQVQQKVKNVGVSPALAKKIVTTWLDSSFSNAPRHKRRVGKIKKIETKNFK
ncbi:MAG: ribose-5-phosphate isomerase [Parcubacteria group bacterium]|nr:ribose-5-phosphate isomerase [Parcubacteria group bacterium]|tara:strand:- start:8613 stop:9098 length:486 start_codon:yes stop_codon:yes gene_type:complete